MQFYFVRHGESEANLLNEFSNRGWKHGLTERGRQQAAVLAQNLKGLPVVRVYCSPLQRAVETAEILAGALGVPCEVTDALREYDCGILEGRSDRAAWDLYQKVLDDWMVHGHWERRIPGGESFSEMQGRFVAFVEGLVAEHSGSQHGVVLVGHGGIYRCMLPMVLANVDAAFALAHPIGHTGMAIAEVRGEELVCTVWD